MKSRPLKVGLDLDGVILYNPARIARPFVAFGKEILFKRKKQNLFTIPRGKLSRYIWYLLHKSSVFTSSGLQDIKELSEKGIIEPYIITARYSFLKHDFEKWLKKMKAERFIKQSFYNTKDEQPHLFKERMIRELGLDVFVEDNWDIVAHLTKSSCKTNQNLKVFWIYNLFDRGITYHYKFPSLRKAARALSNTEV